MKFIAFSVASCLALAGCQTVNEPPPATNRKELSADPAFQVLVRQHVAAHLKDPESARFGPMRVQSRTWNGHDELVVCGWVNAKNSFGGYTGQTPYIGKFQDRSKAFELIAMGGSSTNANLLVLGGCRSAGIPIS